MTLFSGLFTGYKRQEDMRQDPNTDQQMNRTMGAMTSDMSMGQKQTKAEDHSLTRQKTNESMEEEHIDLFANVRDVPVAAWHIHGKNKYYNDEQYRKLVEEANAVMLSGII